MVQTVGKKICHQEGCKILDGDSCLEGIDVNKNECPHFYFDENLINDQDIDSEQNVTEKKNVVQLFTGREMTLLETSLITNNYDCKLIVIIGESESGKTTLLAEYFINFQKGPFCEYLFAGSLTQIGFEERCFNATIASGNKKPGTERTKSLEFSFLHLALKPKSDLEGPAHHFLFSDISGERFRDAKTSSTLMRELKILNASDDILFLIDGERIANLDSRSLVIEESKTFIQRALDEGIFDRNTNIKVALTKWDFLKNDHSFDFDLKIVKPFSERFGARLKTLDFTKIAARSENVNVPAGMGLCELLKAWDTKEVKIEYIDSAKLIDSKRAFIRYTYSKV